MTTETKPVIEDGVVHADILAVRDHVEELRFVKGIISEYSEIGPVHVDMINRKLISAIGYLEWLTRG